ncbi:MAG: phosphoglycerate dehydrogenase [Oscillospiraceae bacterium]|nr:phosphoglycerate dehydrogenase [Oscillospiraceae bacterium]
MKILVTPTSLQPGKNSDALDKLRAFSSDLIFNTAGRPLTDEELIPLLNDCDGYLAGLDNVTRRVLDKCPKLRAISRYGVGYDRVDIAAASEKGIIVTNTPGANSEAVGELTFALLMSVARKIPMLDKRTRKGEWVRSSGIELSGKTIGILGLGAIGRVVARCAGGFDMKVMAYDPHIDGQYCTDEGIAPGTLGEVISKSDVISLHLPLNNETRHMINSDSIAKMKDGVIILNASRGGIIDENALYDALKRGKIGGAGLDAFEAEPPAGSPLFEFDNVVATPHTGAHTAEATKKMADMAVYNLISVLSGQDCKFVVNHL